jgi:hypothetical protein
LVASPDRLRAMNMSPPTTRLEPIWGLRVNAGAAELSQVALYIHIGTIQRVSPLPAGVRIDADCLNGDEHIANRLREVCPEIARQLRVAHILEGSVRRSGSRVRVTAQLIK